MADLAKLVVRLEAESSRLQSQLDKSEKRAKKWQNKTSKSVSIVKKAFIGLAGVATVGLFTKLVKDSVAAADRIGKVSDAVALTTTEYQKLAFAADLGGVAQSQFNSNMTAFVKRVGEARANTGPLVSFLQKYDQVLLQAIKNTKTQSEAFDLMANAIKNAKTETDQAALANAAFSRAGVSMVNVMRDGSAGLDAMREKAERLGIVLDESTVRNAEKANDQLTIMATVIKNNVIKQVVALSPQIIKIGEAFAETIPKIARFFEVITNAETVDNVTRKIEGLTQVHDNLVAKLEASKDSSGFFAAFKFVDSPEEIQARLDGVIEQIEGYRAKVEELRLADEERAAETTGIAAPSIGAKEAETAALISLEIEHADRLRALYEKSASDRIKAEGRVSQTINSMRMNVFQQGANLLRLFAGESETAAIAIIAIEKGLAIAQTIMNTQVASIRALAELGPIFGPPAAAKIQVLGNIAVGIIAATGLVQASQVGGGGAAAGSAVNPINTQSPEDTQVDPISESQRAPQELHVTIEGILPADPDQLDQLAESIAENYRNGGQSPIAA